MSEPTASATINVPARTLHPPAHLSEAAKAYLIPRPSIPLPPCDDKAAWAALVEEHDRALLPKLQQELGQIPAQVHERTVDGGATVFDISPPGCGGGGVVLELHGGGLVFGGGGACRLAGTAAAARMGQRVWTLDYRMPPAHPFPAALDDCVAAYRALLHELEPRNEHGGGGGGGGSSGAARVVVMGTSAGGNLAAALLLRARAAGLPMPGGLVLLTPEVDLTESGDSMQTHMGVDPLLRTSMMAANQLYAGGHDPAQPLLSPLFGDLRGFPPTILTTGTRDLFLSNTARMHRALRAAGVPAELHVLEAGPHTGFPGSPEGEEIDKEIRRFVEGVFSKAE